MLEIILYAWFQVSTVKSIPLWATMVWIESYKKILGGNTYTLNFFLPFLRIFESNPSNTNPRTLMILCSPCGSLIASEMVSFSLLLCSSSSGGTQSSLLYLNWNHKPHSSFLLWQYPCHPISQKLFSILPSQYQKSVHLSPFSDYHYFGQIIPTSFSGYELFSSTGLFASRLACF